MWTEREQTDIMEGDINKESGQPEYNGASHVQLLLPRQGLCPSMWPPALTGNAGEGREPVAETGTNTSPPSVVQNPCNDPMSFISYTSKQLIQGLLIMVLVYILTGEVHSCQSSQVEQ